MSKGEKLGVDFCGNILVIGSRVAVMDVEYRTMVSGTLVSGGQSGGTVMYDNKYVRAVTGRIQSVNRDRSIQQYKNMINLDFVI